MFFLFKLILTQDFKYVKEMQAEQLLLKRMYCVRGTLGSYLPSPMQSHHWPLLLLGGTLEAFVERAETLALALLSSLC